MAERPTEPEKCWKAVARCDYNRSASLCRIQIDSVPGRMPLIYLLIVFFRNRSVMGRATGALLVVFSAVTASAQSEQFWGGIDTYVKLNSNMRFFFTAAQTRESGASTDAELGPNIDFYLNPLARLKRFTLFELDQSKSRPLTLRLGYRYLPSTSGPTENRIVMEATPRYPLKAGILISNRNRADLRFISGQFSWRYRNRLAVERAVPIFSYHFIPYVRAEAYYDGSVRKWSRTSETAGAAFPIRKRIEIEPYYEHQNDTSKAPNRQVNAVGLTLSLFF
jgi:hypothetical protein